MGALEIGGGEGGCVCSRSIAVDRWSPWTRRLAPLVLALALSSPGAAWALDGSQPSPIEKIPLRLFKSAQQALRMGIEELRAGDSKSSIEALKYAAEGGQSLAQWKLGRMYADGDGVPHDDLKAYEYFDQIVRNYSEDESDRRDLGAVSNAIVAIGIYSLNGIANSPIQADPDRAFELFMYAATTFGDPDAQYNLARMYMDGVGGLEKNNMRAARWLSLAAEKHHRPAQAVLGHLLFVGDGVPRQRAHGLMWLTIAKNAAHGAKDQWMIDLFNKDFGGAADDDKQMASVYVTEYGKGREEVAAPARPVPVEVPNGRGNAPPLLPPSGMSRPPAPPAPMADAGPPPPTEPPRE
jgi:exopolysaccharide production negative regulator